MSASTVFGSAGSAALRMTPVAHPGMGATDGVTCLALGIACDRWASRRIRSTSTLDGPVGASGGQARRPGAAARAGRGRRTPGRAPRRSRSGGRRPPLGWRRTPERRWRRGQGARHDHRRGRGGDGRGCGGRRGGRRGDDRGARRALLGRAGLRLGCRGAGGRRGDGVGTRGRRPGRLRSGRGGPGRRDLAASGGFVEASLEDLSVQRLDGDDAPRRIPERGAVGAPAGDPLGGGTHARAMNTVRSRRRAIPPTCQGRRRSTSSAPRSRSRVTRARSWLGCSAMPARGSVAGRPSSQAATEARPRATSRPEPLRAAAQSSHRNSATSCMRARASRFSGWKKKSCSSTEPVTSQTGSSRRRWASSWARTLRCWPASSSRSASVGRQISVHPRGDGLFSPSEVVRRTGRT
jgi:hypothetical protein